MRGFHAIGLHAPKAHVNVGSALRAAACYGSAFVAASGQRYQRALTDPNKAFRHVPLLQVQDLHDCIPYDCVPVAVDLVEGAVPLSGYTHPERAFYVFGPEDGTLGDKVLSWCRDKVYIPTKGCMNLAATVNVILYDRITKRGERYDHEKGWTR